MKTTLNLEIAEKYHSASQRIRVLTEAWVDKEVYCPNCGTNINRYERNRPVADFFCPKCTEEFELKSKGDSIGSKIVDGAYRIMLQRLKSANNPNLFLLNYDPLSLEIENFLVVPKHFFIPDIIEQRNPLSQRQGGRVGSAVTFS
jgi:type II restriction enzyme